MDRKSLEQYLVLCETLHFARTSELCNVSPSTLTRIVKRLEAEVGHPLLLRDSREVCLTHQGRAFQLYARDVLDRWQALQSELSEGVLLAGKLNVFCSVTASYSFLPELLTEFRRLYPTIDINLRTGDAALSLSKVKDGEADLVIAAKADPLPVGLLFHSMAATPLVLIAPSIDCAITKELRGGVAWYDLPLIQAESGVVRQRLDRWFKLQNCQPQDYANVAGHEAIVSMVNLGCGVGVVPELVLNNSPVAQQLQLLDLQPPLQPLDIGLCVQARSLRNPLIKAFWDLALQRKVS